MRRIVTLFTAFALFAGIATAADEEKKDKGKEQADKMFGAMDKDGNGKVNKEEFKKFFEERAKEKGKAGDKIATFADRLFGNLDADSDGSVSKEEFGKFRDSLGDGKLKEKLKEQLKKKKKDD